MRWGGPAVNIVSWPGERARQRGVARPPTTLHQGNRKVVPVGIPGHDQADFPHAGPALQVGLALNRAGHAFVGFSVDETVQLVSVSESRSGSVLMFPNTTSEIIRYTQIKRSVWTIGHYADPAGRHGRDDRGVWLRKCLPAMRFRKAVGGRATRHARVRSPGHDTESDGTGPAMTGERTCSFMTVLCS
jgi:hypothetical protein